MACILRVEEEEEEEEEEEDEEEEEEEEEEGEEQGQESPYNRLTPDRPPLAALTGNTCINIFCHWNACSVY